MLLFHFISLKPIKIVYTEMNNLLICFYGFYFILMMRSVKNMYFFFIFWSAPSINRIDNGFNRISLNNSKRRYYI